MGSEMCIRDRRVVRLGHALKVFFRGLLLGLGFRGPLVGVPLDGRSSVCFFKGGLITITVDAEHFVVVVAGDVARRGHFLYMCANALALLVWSPPATRGVRQSAAVNAWQAAVQCAAQSTRGALVDLASDSAVDRFDR